MANKRYIARKIGGQYVVTPANPYRRSISVAWMVGGGLLTLGGLSRKSAVGLLAAVGGGAMICRGATGRNPFATMMDWIRSIPRADAGTTPSYPHDLETGAEQVPSDEVEEASMESFPASDPPARTAMAAP